MKTAEELGTLSLNLYWHEEHGEGRKAVEKLHQLQVEAFRAGMTEAAEIVNNARGEGGQDLRSIKSQILSARDAKHWVLSLVLLCVCLCCGCEQEVSVNTVGTTIVVTNGAVYEHRFTHYDRYRFLSNNPQ